jgi:hypothetical protein
MHRSGTSAATRALIAMGIDLGSNLMPSYPSNPKGFWEDNDIYKLSEEILFFLDSSWHKFAPLTRVDLEKLKDFGYLDKAREILISKFSDSHSSIFGFKDPRTAKLLLFWQKVFQEEPYQVAYLLPYRNPLSVAQSLKKRDGFELTKSYLLWLLHVIPCLAETIGSKRVLVNYDDLLEDPVSVVSAMSQEFELPIDEALLEEYATDFLDKELRHTRHTIEDLRLDSACPELVRKVYSFLEEVRLGKEQLDSEANELKIQVFVVELQRMAPILELLDTKYQQNSDFQITVANKGAEINRLHGLIANQHEQCEDLDAKSIAAEQQLQNLQNDFVLANELSRNVKDQLLNAVSEIVDLKGNLDQETHALQIAKSELIDATQRIDLQLLRCEQAEQQQGFSIRQLELANETIATHNQVISQLVRSNQKLQTELAAVAQLMRSSGWLTRFVAPLKKLLSIRASGAARDIDLSNLPPDFDPLTYLRLNPDVALAGFDPRRHYLLHGKTEARKYKNYDT